MTEEIVAFGELAVGEKFLYDGKIFEKTELLYGILGRGFVYNAHWLPTLEEIIRFGPRDRRFLHDGEIVQRSVKY